MRITKKSKLLMEFFMKYQCIPHEKPKKTTKTTKILFKKLFKEISESYERIGKTKIMDPVMEKIQNVSDIPRPQQTSLDMLPSEIVNYIYAESVVKVSYSFSLFDKKIRVHFVDEKYTPEQYSNYLECILLWLGFIIPHTSKECSQELSVFVYLMDLEKRLPRTRVHILDQIHVNTAFTYSCQKKNEIVIFRKEEWFKVLIHETFHNLGLDFSNMNNVDCHRIIRSFFPLKSEVNLFEAYTEFWAEVLNALFVSFFSLKNKKNADDFITTAFSLIYLEQCFSYFQMVKVLQFMGLRYENLYSQDSQSQMLRENLYRENTNVFAYYIIKTILLSHYQEFMGWCEKEHISLFDFKKTSQHQKNFCGFIETYYTSPAFLSNVNCVERSMVKMKQYRGKDKAFLMNTLRMSVCELSTFSTF
jgi:hypothetical protein